MVLVSVAMMRWASSSASRLLLYSTRASTRTLAGDAVRVAPIAAGKSCNSAARRAVESNASIEPAMVNVMDMMVVWV